MSTFARWFKEALLTLVQLHKSPPNICITRAARDQLLVELGNTMQVQKVAAFLWASEPPAPRRWRIAIYDRAIRDFGRVFVIEGISFIFLHESAFKQLESATLDYSNSRFAVVVAA